MHHFEPLNKFFDKIFVITLERSTNRQEHINEALNGLNYQFFFGADKHNLSLEELRDKNIYNETLAIRHHRYSKPMNAGQIGCALSHKYLYQEIITNEYNRTLILEDDVEPINESLQLFPEIINELPEAWELLYFDYSKNEKPRYLKRYWYHLQKAIGRLKKSHTVISNLYPKNFGKHISIAGFHDYTDAYALTLSGAKKLMELQSPVSYVADNLLAIASASKKINSFISHPKLFTQLSQGESSSFDSLL
ncbi:MAG TPA: glycosyltransferase family 25 protein [Chitinophagaceae bacterium]|nr:glycosyltransferase family 25 protein [Chitinophagaceae bacterium]